MTKTRTVFQCQACAAQYNQWTGHCSSCGGWNTLQEELNIVVKKTQHRGAGYAGASDASIVKLGEVPLAQQSRIPSHLAELDRVLGGGIVPGSVILLGGDPGIGKSTILLQTLTALSQSQTVLYVTGEESLQQLTLRAKRLQLKAESILLLAETQIEKILQLAQKVKPQIMVIDSIQTMYTELLPSAPGGVGQVRESAAQLVQFAKQSGIALFVVGHVTKEGSLAGPRVLEHMVDAVLYFEGQFSSQFRLIRAIKNRFGAVNELGVFAMTDKGLKEVTNPSAIFLTKALSQASGSVVLVTWEGTRPLLVEVQALVDTAHGGNPRRVTVGLEQNRLAMLLAVLHRHGGIVTYDQDVFVNVVGGVRVTETAADLALLLSVISSLQNRPLPNDLVVFGEVGLAGEIRPVQSGILRLKEAAKHGFKRAIVAKTNAPKQGIEGMEIVAVTTLSEAITAFRDFS